MGDYLKVLEEVQSPDGRYFAQVWQQEVNLGRSVKLFTTDGSWSGEERTIFGVPGKQKIEVIWKDGKNLVIRAPHARAHLKAASWRDVAIRYEDLR
jgi:hypothetical protein